jgi:hypothetical protein
MTPDEDPCRGIMSPAPIHQIVKGLHSMAKVCVFAAFWVSLALAAQIWKLSLVTGRLQPFRGNSSPNGIAVPGN